MNESERRQLSYPYGFYPLLLVSAQLNPLHKWSPWSKEVHFLYWIGRPIKYTYFLDLLLWNMAIKGVFSKYDYNTS
jgi:hypothetical protein